MVSKRGMLAVDEVVKTVLGIAIFIFILFILFAFANMVRGSLKEEQAKNTLDNLVYEVQHLTEGQKKDVLLEGPKDWMILQLPNTNKTCICSSEYLSKSGKEYVYCSENGKCADVKGISIVGNYLNSIQDKSRSTSSVCFTDGSSVLGNPNSLDKCILISKVPTTLRISNDSGVLNVLPVDSNSINTLNSLDSFKETVNALSDGQTASFNLDAFSGKMLYVAKTRIWICNPPTAGFSTAYLLLCARSLDQTGDVNPGLNLTIYKAKKNWVAKDSMNVYSHLIKKDVTIASLTRKGNEINISFAGK